MTQESELRGNRVPSTIDRFTIVARSIKMMSWFQNVKRKEQREPSFLYGFLCALNSDTINSYQSLCTLRLREHH